MAFLWMRDVGFTPRRSASIVGEMRGIPRSSFEHGSRNERIPSAQRATVLSSDNLLGSLGAAGAQPGLGRIADVRGYPASYLAAAGVELLAWPFLLLARRERAGSDPVPDAGPAAQARLGRGGAASTRKTSDRGPASG